VAKVGGLGKGADILFGGSSFSGETFDGGFGAKAQEIVNATEETLPKGLSLKNGELFADVSLLVPNPHQPRKEFNEDALSDLAQSIREHGVIQPILIEDAKDGTFYIIAGERRTRASRLAGLTEVPVRLKNYSEERKLEIALIENIQRENLNPIEEALAYQSLMSLSRLNQEEVAVRVGKSRSAVTNALRLLKLPEDMQNALAEGKISAGHARALLSVNDLSDQRILYGKIIGMALSVRETEQAANELNGNVPKKETEKKVAVTPKDPDIAYLEQQFIDKLGTKVTLKGSLDKGTLEIAYFSRDDLDRLYEIIS